MSEPPNNDNIVALPQRWSVQKKPVSFVNCAHKKMVIDVHLRMFVCSGCGKVVDPFDWLLGWVNAEDKELTALRGLKAQTENLREQIVALKKERAALKSQLDRLLIAQNKARADAKDAS